MRKTYGVVGILALCLAALAGCPQGQRFSSSWNQFHSDPSNSGQVLTATQSAKAPNVLQGSINPVAYSSPAIAPDGSVYVSTFSADGGTVGNALVKLPSTGVPALMNNVPLGGELSSPAVDAAGNVYVTQYLGQTQASHLRGFQGNGEVKFDIVFAGETLAPPKVMNLSGGSLIFEPFVGNATVGGTSHVQVFNDQGTLLKDLISCASYHSGYTVPGLNLLMPCSSRQTTSPSIIADCTGSPASFFFSELNRSAFWLRDMSLH